MTSHAQTDCETVKWVYLRKTGETAALRRRLQDVLAGLELRSALWWSRILLQHLIRRTLKSCGGRAGATAPGPRRARPYLPLSFPLPARVGSGSAYLPTYPHGLSDTCHVHLPTRVVTRNPEPAT